MDYRNNCGEKGTAWPLSKSERGPQDPRLEREGPETPAWIGFYCFSRHITSRMILIYYAQVCFGWLPFTDNKGEDVDKYMKEGYFRM